MEIDIDAEELVRALEQFQREADGHVQQAFRTGLDLIAATAKQIAPKKTSELANSITVTEVSGSFWAWDLEGEVVAQAPHAMVVEMGSKPHEIRPRHRRALRIPMEGGFGFFGKVNHPGTSPQPFLQPALEQHTDDLVEEMAAGIELALRRAGF